MSNEILQLAGSFVTTAAGAFLGAWVAFKLEESRRSRDERRRGALDGRRALLDLTFQLNTLTRVQSYLAEPAASPERWRHLVPLVPAPEGTARVDRDSLHFLLDSEKPHLIEEISLADEQFAIVLGVLAQRNITMRRFQKRVAELEPEGAPPAEAAIGKDLVAELAALTDGLYDSVDHALLLNDEAFRHVREQLLKLFPESAFPDPRADTESKIT